MSQTLAISRSVRTALWLVLWLMLPVWVQAAPPDLTGAGVIATIDRTYTYNLGPTGLRGWIYVSPGNVGADGLITDESRQILVTVAEAPGNGVLAVNDVILGAMAGSSGTVPLFASDCRKAFGVAIGDAEKTGAGTLRVKRWRAGTTTDVNIPMTIMGNYSATAPYSCPKSAQILANARNRLVSQLLANDSFLNGQYEGAINGLALLASVAPGDPNYAEVQARLQTYARGRAAAGPQMVSIPVWDWGQIGLFLAEYYLITGDVAVLPGINQYALTLAQSQSMFGTFGHGPSVVRVDGSGRRSVAGYGPVNQCGIPANMAILMCKKALVAGGQAVSPEIDAAIQRGSNFLAYYVNKGSIPYGEHAPGADNHSSNGKDPMCAMFFSLQTGRAVETEYFTRMSVAGFTGREYGHTGQGFSYMWGGMGANVGGAAAAAEYLNKVRWHLDLERRTDGSFVYDGQEQYGAGTTGDGTYLGTSDYALMNPTATYLLTYALPLQRLYITGKNANSANTLDSTKIANAIAAATYKFDRATRTVAQLIGDLSEYDPVVRNYAAQELATRTLSGADLTTLRNMVTGANANGRMGACQTLGILQDATALPLLTARLSDTDLWVRSKAATAIRNYSSVSASTQLTSMLNAFTANATNPDVIDWSDPIQISNGTLSLALFGNGVPDGSPGNDVASYSINAAKNLLYPAVKASFKQPDSYPRSGAGRFCSMYLTLSDVQALIPDVLQMTQFECQADRMWSATPRAKGISTLSKYQIQDGIRLALSMMEVPTGFEMGSDEYLIAALNALAGYGDAARWTLPTLRGYLATWDPLSSQYTTLISTIASIDSAITAPAMTPGLAVATPQIVTTAANTAKSITLTGSSCRDPSVTFAIVAQPAHGVLTGSAPNLTYTPTAGYTGPDHFKFQTADTLTTSATATVGIIVGTAGTGLKGEYFDNADFSNLKLTRTDAQVNFDWGASSPNALLAADTFSVRWGGQLLVPETGTYTFSTLSSEGTRLYINGVPVIDNFVDQSTKWVDGTPIQLTAGQMVEIQMEYYENTGSAVAKLKWIGPSVAGEGGAIIPQVYLFDGTGISNRMPYANAQNVSTLQNTPRAITLTGSGGSLTYTVLTQPTHGVLTGTVPYLTYTPTTNYNGSDSFTFLVNNGNGNSSPATVSISIWANLPATYTWKNAADGNLNLAANWISGAAPAATGQSFYNLNFAPSGTYTVTHNLNNGFQLNQLNVSGNTTFAGSNSISFVANGALLPQFNQNSTNAVTVNTPLSLASMTTLGGNGGGQVTLAGLISGSGGLIKNTPGVLRINNYNNTYSGGTVINAGKVTFPDGDGNVNPCLGTGPVTLNPSATLNLERINLPNAMLLNGGKITAGNSFASFLSGPVTLTGVTTFDFGATGGFEISGNINGSGGLTTIGTTNWSLSGNNSYTGLTTIQAGSIYYQAASAVGPGAIDISNGGKATLNYSGNRVIASLTLGGITMPSGSYGSTASPATFKNDGYFSGTGMVTVLPSTTTALSLTSGSNPSNLGASLTFTATVTGSTPTGNVAFYAGNTLLGTSALNGSYQASLTTSSLATGSYSITARYAGNPTNGASTSNALAINITSNLPVVPTNILAVSGNNQIGLTWMFSPGATGYHVKRSLTNGGPYTTIGNPTTAAYDDLSAVNGTTYFYVISAFNGNGESANSQQIAVIRSVQPSTVVLVSSPIGSGVSGASVTFTATVSGIGVVPTGTVTFKDGATVLGAGSLSSGTVAFTTSALALGSHLITAEYGGDANYYSSISPLCAYSVTTQLPTTDTVINLGTWPTGTNFTVAGGLYTKIPTGTLPPGSILRAVSWNVRLSSGVPYLGDLTVYIADSDGTNPVLQVGSYGASIDGNPPFMAPLKLPWNAGGDYSYGAAASTILTAANGVPAFDLNPKTVFLETCYDGGWAGTITLTHDNAALIVTTPSSLLATPGINQIGLAWTATAGAAGYYVKRSLVNGGPYTVIGSSASASYTDLTAAAGTTYYYTVSAFNNYGVSADSSQVSATAFSSLFEGWANTAFANGVLSNKSMTFDFDRGGLDTGIEWVVGGDPTVGGDDASKAPVFDNTSDPTYFIYTYRRTDAANTDPKTTITVEYGSDLSGWTTAVAGANIVITPSDNFYGSSPGVDKVVVKIKRTLATSGKMFSRLKVVIAP